MSAIRLRVGPGLRTAIRHPPRYGVFRMEHRHPRPRQRTVPGEAGLHQTRVQDCLRPRRRPSRVDRGLGAEGLAAGLPRRRRCSRWPTPTGCVSTNCAICKRWTSPAMPMPANSVDMALCRCATARPRRDPRPSAAASSRCSSWTPEVIADWLAHGQACMGAGLDLFPSERGRVGRREHAVAPVPPLLSRSRVARRIGSALAAPLYATHLIEDGWDAKFVQDQMGHDHASTTSLYTCVSSDYRVSTLRRALDSTIANALSFGEESS